MDTKSLGFLAIAAVLAIALFSAQPAQSNYQLYNEWKLKLNSVFDAAEDQYRFKVFEENLAKINAHNSKIGKTHTEGLNQFSFLTKDEFKAQYLSSFAPNDEKVVEGTEESSNGPTVDWVTYGAVSPVKNQGSCVASYAFSSVGALEGMSYIVYKTQQEMSAQQLVDCTQSYGNNGCSSGTMTASFAYVHDKGISLENTYPYIGSLGSCKVSTGFFRIAGYTTIKTGDCNTLANALQAKPISVAVDGNNFQTYRSGIFYNCGSNLSLAVTLVGMDDYAWKLKNSWGNSWGESGYIRIGRGNTCGVCNAAAYPNPL